MSICSTKVWQAPPHIGARLRWTRPRPNRDGKSSEEPILWDQSLRLTAITRQLKEEADEAVHFVVFDACCNVLKLRRAGTRTLIQTRGYVPMAQERGMRVARQPPRRSKHIRKRQVEERRWNTSAAHPTCSGDRRLHDRPALAPKVTRSSSSCSNVSPIASAAPVPAASRASFEG